MRGGSLVHWVSGFALVALSCGSGAGSGSGADGAGAAGMSTAAGNAPSAGGMSGGMTGGEPGGAGAVIDQAGAAGSQSVTGDAGGETATGGIGGAASGSASGSASSGTGGTGAKGTAGDRAGGGAGGAGGIGGGGRGGSSGTGAAAGMGGSLGTGGAGSGGAGRGGTSGGASGGPGGGGGVGGQTAACGNNRIDPGEICFGLPVRLATATPANVRIGRFDGDQHLDVLVYSLWGRFTEGAPAILYGSGDGTFSTPQAVSTLGTQVGGLDIGDIDGNGTDDLVAGAFNGDLIGVVRTGQGTGREQAYSSYMATNYHRGFAGVAIGRLPASISQPADALSDILALSRNRLVGPPERFTGYFELFPATASGMFGPSALTNVSGPNSSGLTTNFQLIDMDGSGTVDVVVADATSKSISVLFDILTPQYRPVSLNYQPGNAGAQVGPGVVIEDFDGDGARDISAAQPLPIGLPEPAIYWGNKASRSFAAATGLGITAIPYAGKSWGVAGDMNNDGIMDLVVGPLEPANPSDSTSSRIGIYLGRGQRSFQRLALIDLPGIIPLDCAVGDLNEDGVRDLVFGTLTTSELHVLLSTR